MRTIALLNQKGGVGKTSTCHHLAGTLAKGGLRVLLIDNDPQASLTQGFFGHSATLAIHPGATVAAAYDADIVIEPESLIRSTTFKGISLVPGSAALNDYNLPRKFDYLWGESLYGLRRFVADVGEAFDICLIDCPPNICLCSWAALVASEGVVVPVQPEDYGAQGISAIRTAISEIRATVHPDLRLLGYLITMIDSRRSIHVSYESVIRQAYGPDVFAAKIPTAKDFVEALAKQKPVIEYKPKSAAAKAVQALADEFLQRLKGAVANDSEEAA